MNFEFNIKDIKEVNNGTLLIGECEYGDLYSGDTIVIYDGDDEQTFKIVAEKLYIDNEEVEEIEEGDKCSIFVPLVGLNNDNAVTLSSDDDTINYLNSPAVLIENFDLTATIDSNNSRANLEFCKISLPVPKKRAAYVSVKKAYEELADILADEFSDFYESEMPNMDKVSEKGLALGLGQIVKAAKLSVDALIKVGVYDVDEASFISDFFLEYCTWEDDFEQINGIYMDIILSEEEKDAYRTARRQNRGRWVGGGFGIKGAIKGSIQAGAMNMVTGLAHGTFNLIAKGISSMIAEGKKSSLYKDPDTKETLVEGIRENIANMSDAFMDAMSHYGKASFDYVSQEEADKAERIFNNIERIDNKNKVVVEILSLDPYFEDIYEYVIANDLDSNSDIAAIADYFGVYIEDYVFEFLDNKYEYLSVDDADEPTLLSAQKDIQNYLEKYSVDESDYELLDSINQRLEEIDIELRTLDGELFDTREEVIFLKEDLVAFKNALQDKMYDTDERFAQVVNIVGKIEFKSNTFINGWMDNLTDLREKQIEELETFDKEIYDKIIQGKAIANTLILQEVKEELSKQSFKSEKYINGWEDILKADSEFRNKGTVSERIKTLLSKTNIPDNRLFYNKDENSFNNSVSDIKKKYDYGNIKPVVIIDTSENNDGSCAILLTEQSVIAFNYDTLKERIEKSVVIWDEYQGLSFKDGYTSDNVIYAPSIVFNNTMEKVALSHKFGEIIDGKWDELTLNIEESAKILKSIYDSTPSVVTPNEEIILPLFSSEIEFKDFADKVETIRRDLSLSEISMKFVSASSGDFYKVLDEEFRKNKSIGTSRVVLGISMNGPYNNSFNFDYIFTEDRIYKKIHSYSWETTYVPIEAFKNFEFEEKPIARLAINFNGYAVLKSEAKDPWNTKDQWKIVCDKMTKLLKAAIDDKNTRQAKVIEEKREEKRMLILEKLGDLDVLSLEQLRESREYILYYCDEGTAEPLLKRIDLLIKKESDSRTYSGVLCASIEERNIVEKEDKELAEMVRKMDFITKEEMQKTFEDLSDYKYTNKTIFDRHYSEAKKKIDTYESKVLRDMFDKAASDKDSLVRLKNEITALEFDEVLVNNEISIIDDAIINFERRELDEMIKGLSILDDKSSEILMAEIKQKQFDENLTEEYVNRVVEHRDGYQQAKLQDAVMGIEEFSTARCDEVKQEIEGFCFPDSLTKQMIDLLESRRKEAVEEDEWLDKIRDLNILSYVDLETRFKEINKIVNNENVRKKFKERVIKKYYQKLNAELVSKREILENWSKSVKEPSRTVEVLDWERLPMVGENAVFPIVHYFAPMDSFFFFIHREKFFLRTKDFNNEWYIKSLKRFELKKGFLGCSINIYLESGVQTINIPNKVADEHITMLNGILDVVKSLSGDESIDTGNQNLHSTFVKTTAVTTEHEIPVLEIYKSENDSENYANLEEALRTIFAPVFVGEYAQVSEKLIRGLMIAQDDKVLFGHDATVFGNGKNGFAITDKGVYYREIFEKQAYIVSYKKIKGAKEIKWLNKNHSTIGYDSNVLAYTMMTNGDQLMEAFQQLHRYLQTGSITKEETASVAQVKVDTNASKIYEVDADVRQDLAKIEDNFENDENLEEALKSIFSSVFVGRYEKVSEKLIKGLMIAQGDKVLFGHDATILGNGKNGFAITDKGVYYREMFEKQAYIVSYEKIKSAKEIRWLDKYHSIIAYDSNILAYTIMTNKEQLMEAFKQLHRYLQTGSIVCKEVTPVAPVHIDTNSNVNRQEANTENAFIYCSQCGTKLSADARFCSSCGNKIVIVDNTVSTS